MKNIKIPNQIDAPMIVQAPYLLPKKVAKSPLIPKMISNVTIATKLSPIAESIKAFFFFINYIDVPSSPIVLIWSILSLTALPMLLAAFSATNLPSAILLIVS